MSKTKGFEVDFNLPNGKIISRHVHKLNEVKEMVGKYKIPAITIHTTGNKWVGTANEVDELAKWPIVPDQIDPKDDDCPICNPKTKDIK